MPIPPNVSKSLPYNAPSYIPETIKSISTISVGIYASAIGDALQLITRGTNERCFVVKCEASFHADLAMFR